MVQKKGLKTSSGILAVVFGGISAFFSALTWFGLSLIKAILDGTSNTDLSNLALQIEALREIIGLLIVLIGWITILSIGQIIAGIIYLAKKKSKLAAIVLIAFAAPSAILLAIFIIMVLSAGEMFGLLGILILVMYLIVIAGAVATLIDKPVQDLNQQ